MNSLTLRIANRHDVVESGRNREVADLHWQLAQLVGPTVAERNWVSTSSQEPYIRRSTAYHLANTLEYYRAHDEGTAQDRLPLFVSICSDIDWISHRIAYDGTDALLVDFDLALAVGVDELEIPLAHEVEEVG